MADNPEMLAKSPPVRRRNRLDIPNLLCVLVWAAAVLALYIYLPLFWQRGADYSDLEANPGGFLLLLGFIVFLVVLISICLKVGTKSPRPSRSILGTACIVLAASVAVGMLAFQVAYAAYANYVHDQSCLAELRFKDISNATYPGNPYPYMFVTRMKTPSVNGIAYIEKGPAVLRIVGETAWAANVQVPVRILGFGGVTRRPRPGFGVEYLKKLSMKSCEAPKEHLDVELVTPEDDVTAPCRVTGYIEVTATFPVFVPPTKFDVVHDGPMQTQEVSFWVVPKKMGSEMLRELHMYKRISMLIPTLLLACSSLIPIFFIGVYPNIA